MDMPALVFRLFSWAARALSLKQWKDSCFLNTDLRSLFVFSASAAWVMSCFQTQWQHSAGCWRSHHPHRLWLHPLHLAGQEPWLWELPLQTHLRICGGGWFWIYKVVNSHLMLMHGLVTQTATKSVWQDVWTFMMVVPQNTVQTLDK